MNQKNVDLIHSMYTAFAAGDVAGVVQHMSPDIVWMEAEGNPYADGNPYVGPDAIVSGVFARCATEWDGFCVNVEELIDAGDTVVALSRYGGAHKTTGLTHNTQVVHVWRLKGGKVVHFQQYADTRQLARVMGAIQDEHSAAAG
jgi:ketosteroid isomerase-like protein